MNATERGIFSRLVSRSRNGHLDSVYAMFSALEILELAIRRLESESSPELESHQLIEICNMGITMLNSVKSTMERHNQPSPQQPLRKSKRQEKKTETQKQKGHQIKTIKVSIFSIKMSVVNHTQYKPIWKSSFASYGRYERTRENRKPQITGGKQTENTGNL